MPASNGGVMAEFFYFYTSISIIHFIYILFLLSFRVIKQFFYKIKIHKWTYFCIIKDEHSHPKTLAAFQNFLFNLLNYYNYARVFFFFNSP